jgi:hypothetical protein
LRHALQAFGDVAGVFGDHGLAPVAQIIRCGTEGVGHAFDPFCRRILLLIRGRAGLGAHVGNSLLCLSLQVARSLLDTLGQVFGLLFRRLRPAAGVAQVSTGAAIRWICAWGCHSYLQLLVRCDVETDGDGQLRPSRDKMARTTTTTPMM